MSKRTKIYFVSDAHLGMHPRKKSLEREKFLVDWLEMARKDATEIYLLGDMFDYWFEYHKVVPRGFVRFLGKITEITDQGIPVHYFTGNHDVWVFDYLPSETGVIVHKEPYIIEREEKRLYLAHGDGLGPGDNGYRIMKWAFHNRFLQWLYARLHPNFATWLAQTWSKKSRYAKGFSTEFLGEDREHLILHSRNVLKNEHFDYFIYGHRHIQLEFPLNERSILYYLGDWIQHFSYAIFENGRVELNKFHKESHENL